MRLGSRSRQSTRRSRAGSESGRTESTSAAPTAAKALARTSTDRLCAATRKVVNARFWRALEALHNRAFTTFLVAAQRRSVDVRASAFAAVGAADVLSVRPDSEPARDLLVDCLDRLPRRIGKHWQWPESRLRYANATLCQALIVGGEALHDMDTLNQGLTHLAVLLGLETVSYTHLRAHETDSYLV